MLFFSLGSVFAFGEVEDFRLKSYYILFLDTFCFDFFVFVGGRKLFRSCMSALHCLNFFLFENPYRPLQYSLSGFFFLKIGFLKVPCLRELWNISTAKAFSLNFLLHCRFQWCCLKVLCKSMFVSLGVSCLVIFVFQAPECFSVIFMFRFTQFVFRQHIDFSAMSNS